MPRLLFLRERRAILERDLLKPTRLSFLNGGALTRTMFRWALRNDAGTEFVGFRCVLDADKVRDPTSLAFRAVEPVVVGPLWGVVFGDDTTLDAARYEVDRGIGEQGLTGARVYLRDGAYRSVVPTSDHTKARKLLPLARRHRADAYIVKMSGWCPTTVDRGKFLEGKSLGVHRFAHRFAYPMLRREGLYSNQLHSWRRELADSAVAKLAKSTPEPAPKLTPEQGEIEQLMDQAIGCPWILVHGSSE